MFHCGMVGVVFGSCLFLQEYEQGDVETKRQILSNLDKYGVKNCSGAHTRPLRCMFFCCHVAACTLSGSRRSASKLRVVPTDGVEPGRRAAEPGLCGGLLQREAVRGPRLVAGRDAGPGRLPLGLHRVGHLRAEPCGRGDAAARAHGRRVARRRGTHGQAQRERDDRPVGAQHGGGLQRAQQQRAGRRGADFSQAFAREGGLVWDFVYARSC